MLAKLDFGDRRILQVAREIAIDIQPLDRILQSVGMTREEFHNVKQTEYFKNLLVEETSKWNSAKNTHERVKIKASVVIEDYLEEAHRVLHDPEETLSGRAEIAKLLAKLAGMDKTGGDIGAAGERISITINMGNEKVEVAREVKTIDHSAMEDY